MRPFLHHTDTTAGDPGEAARAFASSDLPLQSPRLASRAHALCVCCPRNAGTPPLICGGGGKERGGCVPGRGADSAPRRREHATEEGALTIQEGTPSIAMERCEIARICLARTT